MDNFKTFLETSTIHGLTHISTSRKYVRLFWILIVLLGFTIASIIIYHSSQAWNDFPVKTTIETLPITEITLPTVTVCPPENTYTDLNFDLMRKENMTINNNTRNILKNVATQLLLQHLNDTIMKTLTVFEDDQKYYNWYHGNTDIAMLTITQAGVTTYAKSGVVSSPHFGEKLDPDKVDPDIYMWITIIPPEDVCNNNILHLDIEKVSILGLSSGKDNVYIDKYLIDADETSISRNLTKSGDGVTVYLIREVTNEAIMKLTLTHMPGFELQWYFICIDDDDVPTDDIEEYEDTYPTYNESIVEDNNATVDEETTMSVKSVIVIQFIR